MRSKKARNRRKSAPADRTFRGKRCHYCGGWADTKDHIWPKALGGTNGLWNLTPACMPCNAAKAATIPSCTCRKCSAARQKGRHLARRAGILVTE